MEELITIELFGQMYTFKAESGVTNAKEVAGFLANEVTKVEQKVESHNKGMNKITILALAAMNISSEYIELKRKYIELLQNISTRSASVVRMVDSNLQ